jgi:hypothetical protein
MIIPFLHKFLELVHLALVNFHIGRYLGAKFFKLGEDLVQNIEVRCNDEV